MADELTREETYDHADRLVADWLAEAGVAGPPTDAVALALRRCGVSVPPDPDAGVEARHTAAARAIAERLKPELLRRLGVDPARRRPMAGESLVGLLVDRLLLPTPWLLDEGRAGGWDLPTLKKRFATATLERVAWRLLDLSDPCVITVVDNGLVTKRRSNHTPVTKRLHPTEARVQQQVHRDGTPHWLNESGWRVQGWPDHRGDWKREILRSVAEEC